MPRVLITCPPMIGGFAEVRSLFEDKKVEVVCADVLQALDEETLIRMVPEYDAWIIGDDPVTERVLRAGVAGKLRVAIRWGIGMDNVDLAAAQACGLQVRNTPGVFGRE